MYCGPIISYSLLHTIYYTIDCICLVMTLFLLFVFWYSFRITVQKARRGDLCINCLLMCFAKYLERGRMLQMETK